VGLETYWQNYKDRAEQAEKQQRFDIAEVMWSMAVLLSRQCSDGDRRLVFCLDRLGGALLRQRNTELAHHFLTQSLQLKTTPLNLSDMDKSNTLNLMAQLFFTEGKLDQAEQYATQVLQIYMTALGAEHPQTKAASNNLALLRNTISQASAVKPPMSAPPSHAPSAQSSQQLPQVPPPGQALNPTLSAAQLGQVPRPAPAPAGLPATKTTGQVQAIKPIPPTTQPKAKDRTAFDRCERCGEVMPGTECLRCTGTSLRAVSPYDKLTKD
jgi:hypothetical protein